MIGLTLLAVTLGNLGGQAKDLPLVEQLLYSTFLEEPPRDTVLLTRGMMGQTEVICASVEGRKSVNFDAVLLRDVLRVVRTPKGGKPEFFPALSKPTRDHPRKAIADAFLVAARDMRLQPWLSKDCEVTVAAYKKSQLVLFTAPDGSPGDGQVAEVLEGKVVKIVGGS